MSPSSRRRMPTTLTAAATSAFALSAVLAVPPALAAPVSSSGAIKVSGADVTVRAYPGGPAQAATRNTPLRPGMILSSGDERAVLSYPDGTAIRLDPHTAVQIQASTDAILSVGSATRVTRLDLRSGLIRVSVAASARPVFVVAGQEQYAIFRSGAGRVGLGPGGMTTAAEQGGVLLASAGRWTTIPEGHYSTIGSSPTGVRPLLDPPAPVPGECDATDSRACAIAVTASDLPAKVAARWLPLPAGQRSVITLAADPSGTTGILARSTESATEFSADLPAGSYWLFVRAVGADGVEGRPAVFPLRVVRLIADEDTHVRQEGRAALIFQGHRMQVAESAGLIIDEPPGATGPAATQVELRPTDQRRAFRFTSTGQPGHHAWFTLHRRTRSADVDISPGKAVWPRDPVSVAIEFRDNAGPVSEDRSPPMVQLDINGESEPAQFARVGNRWIAEIPARRGGGPWTIRADVFDREGTRLGHGVLHVISARNDSSNPQQLW